MSSEERARQLLPNRDVGIDIVRTRIRNDFAVSYEEGADHAIAQVLCAAAGCAELDEAVAWAMVEFNTAFGAGCDKKTWASCGS